MEEYRPIMTTAPFTALWNASAAGRVQEVLQLLSDGANINEKCGDGGYTPLHTAVFRGQVQVVQNLLEHGADVSVKTSSGDSVLHLACSGARKTGRGAIIRSLFQKGADVHDKDKYGRTPLHRAIAYGSVQSLKLLLDRGAAISIKDGEGYNALHWAVQIHTSEFVQERNRQLRNPRLPANRRKIEKTIQVLQILIAHGTDVHTKISNLSATTDAGKTPEGVAYTEDLKEMMRSALLRAEKTRRAMLEALIMGQHKRLGAAGWTEALGTEAQPLPRVLRLLKRIPDTMFSVTNLGFDQPSQKQPVREIEFTTCSRNKRRPNQGPSGP